MFIRILYTGSFIYLYRELLFPNDQNRFSDIKYFLRMVLCKKTNKRICNLGKLKQAEFFLDFDWDDLIDFKLKAPFIPECVDWTKKFNVKSSVYEKIIVVI
jgi:hypothetical protein